MTKSSQMQLIEIRRGEAIEAIIRRNMEAGMTDEQIARDLGISYHTLRFWLVRLGAQRTRSVRFASEEQQELTAV